ncbi:hypothetical protein AAFF_G00392040 [Aldrovandia affinis]|uniref:Uncharacterized protein n=1 Tax=Aldrovandia affinis TaxID=143900 RepID=A0AAD7SDZ7_9TELE|nr:hypothetical protein AAFF_G00392040 [Aldrovandia affinis]
MSPDAHDEPPGPRVAKLRGPQSQNRGARGGSWDRLALNCPEFHAAIWWRSEFGDVKTGRQLTVNPSNQQACLSRCAAARFLPAACHRQLWQPPAPDVELTLIFIQISMPVEEVTLTWAAQQTATCPG